ncbi:MAG: Fe-S cluster assembly protein SufB, partial [Nitrospinota bacterium]|nr:Fe-S cluster assembly protein SufB [Nitrospinota bacterium]
MSEATKLQPEVARVISEREYKFGFNTQIDSDTFPKGLNQNVVREISKRKGEPEAVLNFRLEAYRRWLEMEEPEWAHVHYPPIDFQDIS